MRLLLATPLYPPEAGGPATYAALLAAYLPAQDVQVDVVKFRDVRGYPPGVRHFLYMTRVMQSSRTADVILALDPVSTGLPALLAARMLGKPFAVKVVGDYAWEQGVQRFGITDTLDEFVKRRRVPLSVALLRSVEAWVAKSARAVIVPSAYLKGILEAWGVPEARLRVIYNAIELGEPVPADMTLASGTMVSVGRLVPWKGFEGLIDALAQVQERVPEARLVIVGDGPERARLAAHAEKAAPGRVTFLGAKSHEETLAVMRQATVLALNSTYEGLSHLLIEALMLGLPVVATRAGGNPELVKDGDNGLLVPPGDTEALAAALVRIMGDPVYAASLAERTAPAKTTFTPERMAAATAALLTSLL